MIIGVISATSAKNIVGVDFYLEAPFKKEEFAALMQEIVDKNASSVSAPVDNVPTIIP